MLPWSTPPIGLGSVLEEESMMIAVKEKIQNGLSWFKAHSPRQGAGQEWEHITGQT